MTEKYDVFDLFKQFHKMVATQFQKSIKTFLSNSEGIHNFTSHSFSTFLHEHGFIKNLVLTRLNKTVLPKGRTAILSKPRIPLWQLPMFLLPFGLRLCYIRYFSSVVCHPKHCMMPRHISYFMLSFIHTLFCTFLVVCYVLLSPHPRTKLSPKSV